MDVKKNKMFGKKKEIKPEPAEKKADDGFSLDDFMNVMKENRDPREMALAINAQNLWDKTKLNMISRLDDELRLYIVKLYIISKFYHWYWSKAQYTAKLVPITMCASTGKEYEKGQKPDPVGLYETYIKDYKRVDPVKVGEVDPAFDDLRNTILELTIAKNGLGRTEALQIISGMEQRLSFMDRMRGGVDRLAGGQR